MKEGKRGKWMKGRSKRSGRKKNEEEELIRGGLCGAPKSKASLWKPLKGGPTYHWPTFYSGHGVQEALRLINDVPLVYLTWLETLQEKVHQKLPRHTKSEVIPLANSIKSMGISSILSK